MKKHFLCAGTVLCGWFVTLNPASAQGTAFTYQGRLIDNGARANGTYDLQFAIYDASSNGNQIGATLTNSPVAVSNGLFTTQLDFGAGVLTNSPLWLEVGERQSGGGSFTTLSPRQALTAAPYAVAAGTLAGSLPASQLSGAIPDARLSTNVALLNGSANFSGTVAANNFSGSGSGLTNVLLAGLDSHGALTLASNATPFLLSAALAAGNTPVSVATADVNGDGNSDLISANFNDNTVTVLTNNGDGTFTSVSTNSVGNAPSSVVAADVNGDGKPDLTVANEFDDTVTVLTNNGDGTFTAASTNNVGIEPFSATVVDINGDGRPDIICADYYFLDNTLTVLLGNGDGTFTEDAGSPYAVGSGPSTAVVADVNNDGKPDLISVNEYDDTLTVLTNNGDGTFTFASTLNVGQEPFWVATADMNGDGKPDLISADGFDNTLTVLTNDGSGGFATASVNPVGNTPDFVLATNLFGPGAPDLVSVNSFDNTLTVLTNGGNGTFGFFATLPAGIGPSTVAAADVNGDGRLDLIAANANDNTLTVLTNSPGALTFTTLFAGDGSGLTGLNASSLTSGTIPDAQLPGDVPLLSSGVLPDYYLSLNVPLLDTDQTFSGINVFSNPGNSFTGTFAGDGSGLTNFSGTNLVDASVTPDKLSPTFGYFYLLNPPDAAATIAPGSAIPFPNNGPTNGITRVNDTDFELDAIGVYEVTWQVSVTEAGQLVLGLDGVEQPQTVVGRSAGSSQIVGDVLIQTTAVGTVLTVRNPSGNAVALTVTPLAGGTQPVTGSLVIKRIK